MVAVAVFGLAGTGCGSSTPSAGTTTTTSAAPTTTTAVSVPALRSMLLTLADMPAGWTAVPDTGNTAKITGCAFHKLVQGALEKASASFDAPRGFPEWREELDAVAPGVAQRLLTGAIVQIDQCHSLQIPIAGGRTITVEVAPVDVPQVGDQSGAWSLAGRYQGVAFTFYVMLARFHSVGAILFYGVLGSAGEAQFATLTARAGAKVESALGSGG
jgi:hypothetical protein